MPRNTVEPTSCPHGGEDLVPSHHPGLGQEGGQNQNPRTGQSTTKWAAHTQARDSAGATQPPKVTAGPSLPLFLCEPKRKKNTKLQSPAPATLALATGWPRRDLVPAAACVTYPGATQPGWREESILTPGSAPPALRTSRDRRHDQPTAPSPAPGALAASNASRAAKKSFCSPLPPKEGEELGF